MTTKRLTLRHIRRMCTRTAFEYGCEFYEDDRVVSVDVDGDLVTGEILASEECPVSISLRTGRRKCVCTYSRAGVCGHMAGVLICASKDLKAALPEGCWVDGGQSLPSGPGAPEMPPRPDYRRETDDMLAGVADPESVERHVRELTDLAYACEGEGDYQEALRVCIQASESVLAKIDYPSMSDYFARYDDQLMRWPFLDGQSTDSPDATPVWAFCSLTAPTCPPCTN